MISVWVWSFFCSGLCSIHDPKQILTVSAYTVQILEDDKANEVQTWLELWKNKRSTLKVCCGKKHCTLALFKQQYQIDNNDVW